ncbi:MAG TPA: histidine phosphatase family protein [Lamprocystis sp. (in: g-proteobacteria)]|nr:histidine phosphatase family protein [Lamprocystis sp. (in: g-proteobacteria)]
MPRELLILRHTKSDWDADAASDFDRPLARRGKHDAPKIGAWLYREGLVPDYVVSSPARRARQTAVKVCKALEIGKDRISWDTDIYDATLGALLDVVGRCPAASTTTLLVGHNPGLEALVRHLSGDDLAPPPDGQLTPTGAPPRSALPERWDQLPEDGKLMPTGALARLEMPERWDQLARGCAHLVSITLPRTL